MCNRHARVRVLTATRSRVLCHSWSSCRHAVSPASAGGRDTSSMSSEPVGAASRAAIPSNGHHRHRALSGKERLWVHPTLQAVERFVYPGIKRAWPVGKHEDPILQRWTCHVTQNGAQSLKTQHTLKRFWALCHMALANAPSQCSRASTRIPIRARFALQLLFWYDYAPEGVCMHQGCSSDAGDFKRYVSCLVPARQRLENVERTFAPVEAPSHARRWGTRR